MRRLNHHFFLPFKDPRSSVFVHGGYIPFFGKRQKWIKPQVVKISHQNHTSQHVCPPQNVIVGISNNDALMAMLKKSYKVNLMFCLGICTNVIWCGQEGA